MKSNTESNPCTETMAAAVGESQQAKSAPEFDPTNSDRVSAVLALSGLLDGRTPDEREAAIEQVASVIREAQNEARKFAVCVACSARRDRMMKRLEDLL